MEHKVARMPRFAAEDGGLASLSVVELGFSGRIQCHAVFSRSVCSPRGGFSFRNVGACSVSSPRSPAERFYDATFEDQQLHFLHACFLCKKQIGSNRDIFMYRGDTPFCSDECRQEQIDIDEAKEKNWNLTSSMKALRNRDQRNPNSSATRAQDYSLHAGTVAAA